MAAILDLSNKAPTARVQLGSRDKFKNIMALTIRGPNLVLLGRFYQSGGKSVKPLDLNTYAMGLTPL